MNSILFKMWFAFKMYILSLVTLFFAFFVFIISYLIPSNTSIFGLNIASELRTSVFGFIISSIIVAIFSKFWERKKIDDLLKVEISQYVEERYRKFYPILDFNPQNKLLDDVFNIQLMFHLKKSTKYFFFGVTARHCGLRLLSLKSSLLDDIHISITHPNCLNIDNDYIKYTANVNNVILSEQVSKTRSDIMFALFTLHKAAIHLQRKIDIYFTSHCSLSRFELMDEVVFFSIQDIFKPSMYPESFMFKDNSIWYKHTMNEFQAIKNKKHTDIILTFHVNDSINEFISNIKLVLGIEITNTDIEKFGNRMKLELGIYRKMDR